MIRNIPWQQFRFLQVLEVERGLFGLSLVVPGSAASSPCVPAAPRLILDLSTRVAENGSEKQLASAAYIPCRECILRRNAVHEGKYMMCVLSVAGQPECLRRQHMMLRRHRQYSKPAGHHAINDPLPSEPLQSQPWALNFPIYVHIYIYIFLYSTLYHMRAHASNPKPKQGRAKLEGLCPTHL